MKIKSLLVLSALLVSSNLGLVSATYAEVTPGFKFSNAPLVEPGIYDGALGNNETVYYKFNASKGQTVKLSAVFTQTQIGVTDVPCTCLVPSIIGYDKNMFPLGSTVGKEYFKYANDDGPYCIRGNDTSPHGYSGSYKVTETGINYVAVSTGWRETCKVLTNDGDPYSVAQIDRETRKALSKIYYDLNITVEGTPTPVVTAPVVAPVVTPVVAPVITREPVVTPPKPKPVVTTPKPTVPEPKIVETEATTTEEATTEAETLVKASATENETVLAKVDKIDNISGFRIFFVGVNSRDLKELKVELTKAQNKLTKLEKALTRIDDVLLQIDIEDQISATEDLIAQLEVTIGEKDNRFSLFGWLFR